MNVVNLRILKTDWVHEKLERLVFILFSCWCALSVLMTLFCFVMGATGNFHIDAEFAGSAFCYKLTLQVYLIAFRVLGVISILFGIAVFCHYVRSFCNFRRFRSGSWFYLLAALLAWSLLCTALSDYPASQFWGYDVICDGFFTYLVYAALFISGTLLSSENHRKKLLMIFCAVTGYLSFIVFAQECNVPFIVYCFPTIRASVFSNTNYCGYVLCLSVVILLGFYLFDESIGRIKKILVLGLFAELFLALLVNDTFGCILAVFVSSAVAYFVYLKRGGRFSFSAVLPILILIIFSAVHYAVISNDFFRLFNDINKIAVNADEAGGAGSGRWNIWVDAVHRIADRPIFGFGPEGFFYDYRYETSGPPHNEFLQLTGYLGIPGAVLYFSAAIQLAVHLWKRKAELSVSTLIGSVAVVCFFVSDFFGHPIYSATPYFWFIYGLITIENESSRPFLLVDEENAAGKKTMKTTAACLAAYLAVCIAIGGINTGFKNERINESTDLLAMRNADLWVQMLMKDDPLTEYAEYWYDADEFTLTPVGDAVPRPCGRGTKRAGGGIQDFAEKYGAVYEYDETVDYTTSAIKVKIDPQADTIDIEWVKVL